MIRVSGVSKAYGANLALDGVSLAVEAGEVFGLVGPNGSGKTTLLRCLVGVARPDAGSVEVAGVDALRDGLEARRRAAFAPGETFLYARMRADELLRFAVAYYPRADVELGLALLDRLGVPRRQRVGRLSHGMKRKLLLAQAIAARAQVVLLDEPMEGLDPEARRAVEDLLRGEAAAGRTVFFSSHDLASVQRVCGRVAFLRLGRVLEVGGVGAFLERAGRVLWIELRQPVARAVLPDGAGLRWSGAGTRWTLEFEGHLEDVLARLRGLPLAALRTAATLEEVFQALYGPELPAAGGRAPERER